MTLEEIIPLAQTLLTKSTDWIALQAGEEEQFRYVSDCHRVIKGLLAHIEKEKP